MPSNSRLIWVYIEHIIIFYTSRKLQKFLSKSQPSRDEDYPNRATHTSISATLSAVSSTQCKFHEELWNDLQHHAVLTQIHYRLKRARGRRLTERERKRCAIFLRLSPSIDALTQRPFLQKHFFQRSRVKCNHCKMSLYCNFNELKSHILYKANIDHVYTDNARGLDSVWRLFLNVKIHASPLALSSCFINK